MIKNKIENNNIKQNIIPINGLYLTGLDFQQWQDYFTNLLSASEEKNKYDITDSLRTKNITFVVTEKCNLNCSYCYEIHKTDNVMSKEIAKKGVDFLFNNNKINNYYNINNTPGVILEFIGGEPLLEIDLIDFIVEYFKFKAFEIDSPWAINYMISISSNGILYKSDKVQNFLKKNKDRVSIGISIDGNKSLHDACRVFPNGEGSYDIVEEAVRLWVKNELKPQTKMTLSPFNVGYLNDAVKNVWNLGVIGSFTNCVFEEGWTTEYAKILYYEMKKLADYILDNNLYNKYYISLFDESIGKPRIEDKNWCGGNGEMLAIGTDGKCFPCIRFMKYALSTPGREEKPIGNIFDGLESKEENEWLNELKKVTMSSQSDEKCNNCQIATGCSLCTGYNYDKFGTPNKKANYICEMHHARILSNRYYWQKLYNLLGMNNEFRLNVPIDKAIEIIGEDEYNMLVNIKSQK